VHEILMYSRPGCGLCDEARAVILAERDRTAFEYREVDISGDDGLERAFGIRIPVILVDGVERFEVRIDAGELRDAISDGGAADFVRS
jgi:glutaredoxin